MRGALRSLGRIREARTITSRSGRQERAMPMLLWFPMIVMAGMYQAMSDDVATWHRAFSGIDDRDA
jgi:hypothetical protein